MLAGTDAHNVVRPMQVPLSQVFFEGCREFVAVAEIRRLEQCHDSFHVLPGGLFWRSWRPAAPGRCGRRHPVPVEQVRRTFYWLAAVAAVPWEVVLWAAVLAGRLSSARLTPT